MCTFKVNSTGRWLSPPARIVSVDSASALWNHMDVMAESYCWDMVPTPADWVELGSGDASLRTHSSDSWQSWGTGWSAISGSIDQGTVQILLHWYHWAPWANEFRGHRGVLLMKAQRSFLFLHWRWHIAYELLWLMVWLVLDGGQHCPLMRKGAEFSYLADVVATLLLTRVGYTWIAGGLIVEAVGRFDHLASV